jgi:DHA1 family bicyclomycin/chloramphenicol resistance-like MFS transporter
MVANQLNASLVRKVGSDRLMRLGALMPALSSLWLAIDAWNGIGGLAGLVAPLFVFVSAAGLIVANTIVGALDSFPHMAGAASALIGTLQYGTRIGFGRRTGRRYAEADGDSDRSVRSSQYGVCVLGGWH